MTDRNKTKKYIYIGTIIFFVLLTLGYTAYEIQKIVFGPKITILSPENGSLASTSEIQIIGTTKNIQDISMNDRKIFIDEQGNFREELLLSYGYNIIMLKANDRFGRGTEKKLELIYK